MESSEPVGGGPDPADPRPDPGSDERSSSEDTLRRLEERLDRASDAAERLLAEAARASAESVGRVAESLGRSGHSGRAQDASSAPKPPPAGWEEPRGERDSGRSGDLEIVLHALQSVRDLIPAELQQRIAAALRELLLALRALIDWYLERMEQRRARPANVQDIPIL